MYITICITLIFTVWISVLTREIRKQRRQNRYLKNQLPYKEFYLNRAKQKIYGEEKIT